MTLDTPDDDDDVIVLKVEVAKEVEKEVTKEVEKEVAKEVEKDDSTRRFNFVFSDNNDSRPTLQSFHPAQDLFVAVC